MEHGINLDLINIIQWFQQNAMIANPDKYQALVLANTAYDFVVKSEEKPTPVSSEIQLVGVTLDNKLKLDSHIASICRRPGGQVNALNRLKNVLPCKTKEALYHAFILPHFDYCSQIWHQCGARNTKKLGRVKERALRFVYKDKKALTIDCCFQEKAPTPIVNLLKVKDTKYNLRGTNLLSLPKIRSTKHGLRSFRYFAAKTWNALPDSIRAMAGTREFLRNIRHVAF